MGHSGRGPGQTTRKYIKEEGGTQKGKKLQERRLLSLLPKKNKKPTKVQEDKGDEKSAKSNKKVNADKERKIERATIVKMEMEEEKEEEEDDDPLLQYEAPVFQIMWRNGVGKHQALENGGFDP